MRIVRNIPGKMPVEQVLVGNDEKRARTAGNIKDAQKGGFLGGDFGLRKFLLGTLRFAQPLPNGLPFYPVRTLRAIFHNPSIYTFNYFNAAVIICHKRPDVTA